MHRWQAIETQTRALRDLGILATAMLVLFPAAAGTGVVPSDAWLLTVDRCNRHWALVSILGSVCGEWLGALGCRGVRKLKRFGCDAFWLQQRGAPRATSATLRQNALGLRWCFECGEELERRFDGLLGNLEQKLLEETECFALVLEQRVLLPVGAKVDALLDFIHDA